MGTDHVETEEKDVHLSSPLLFCDVCVEPGPVNAGTLVSASRAQESKPSTASCNPSNVNRRR